MNRLLWTLTFLIAFSISQPLWAGLMIISASVAGPGGTGSAVIDNSRPPGVDISSLYVSKDFTSVAYIDITFTVDEGGTFNLDETNVIPPSTGIKNDTGVAWTDFHFEFVQVPQGATAFFPGVTLYPPFSLGFFGPDATVGAGTGNYTLNSNGHDLGSGDTLNLALHPELSSAGTYVIRETPSVPEPSTLVISLILFGMFGVVWLRKRLKQTMVAA